jgi:hypothetical protein
MSIDPNVAAPRVTAGVDWAKDDHAVCAARLKQMTALLLRAGALHVGIERGDGRSSTRCWRCS